VTDAAAVAVGVVAVPAGVGRGVVVVGAGVSTGVRPTRLSGSAVAVTVAVAAGRGVGDAVAAAVATADGAAVGPVGGASGVETASGVGNAARSSESRANGNIDGWKT